MTEQQFVEKMVDLMDTEAEVNIDTELANIEEWDSLAYVAFLAYCRTTIDKKVSPAQVKEAKTIKDLYELVKN